MSSVRKNETWNCDSILKMCNRFPAISAESANVFFVFKARNRNGRRKLCGEKWERGGDVTKMNQCWINTATCILFSYRKGIKALNWSQSDNESVRRPAVVRVTNVECAWVCITYEIYCTIVLISTYMTVVAVVVGVLGRNRFFFPAPFTTLFIISPFFI